MKIFLTGSTSYLGSKFIQLYGHCHSIFGVARTDVDNPVDLTDFSAMKKAFLDCDPDIVIHTAADLGRDTTTAETILQTNPEITRNLVHLASVKRIPFVFTSTEAVYGGKENTGNYQENSPYQPRSLYGESKVKSEQIIIDSGLPYLIVRGHRFVGVNGSYVKPKQFPDALRSLQQGKPIKLDPRKLFKPTFINNLCDIFGHYLACDRDKNILINVGVDQAMSYHQLVKDVAAACNLDETLIAPDGDETGWPLNSTLCLDKIRDLGYPMVGYDQMLSVISQEVRA